MKFDFAIMNPPYDHNLHLKFLEKVIKVAGKTVNISPISWLQFPTREKPEFLMKHAEYFNILDRNDSNNAFGIDMGMNIAVGVFTGKEQEYQVKWYDYHPFGKHIYSIYKKITGKETPVTKEMTTNPQSEYTLRLCITRRFVTECAEGRLEGSRDPKKFFTIVSRNYDTMKRKDLSGGIHFLNFNTENERDNAWNSFMTLFVRFCIAMDESVKLCPYMGDYTEPWTNARFCEYFSITGFISDTEAEPGSEWDTILETMKKYA